MLGIERSQTAHTNKSFNDYKYRDKGESATEVAKMKSIAVQYQLVAEFYKKQVIKLKEEICTNSVGKRKI